LERRIPTGSRRKENADEEGHEEEEEKEEEEEEEEEEGKRRSEKNCTSPDIAFGDPLSTVFPGFLLWSTDSVSRVNTLRIVSCRVKSSSLV
jgi:hypothetical protein